MTWNAEARAAYDRRKRANPEYVRRTRERCAAWAVEHRGTKRRQPWLIGQPPFWPFLPGVVSCLSIDPPGKWPLALRNLRAVHGTVCHLIGEPHEQRAALSVFPYGQHWWIWLASDKATTLAGRAHEVNLFNGPRRLIIGLPMRLKSPVVQRRGRQRVRIDAITPVSTRSMGVYRTCPEASHLRSSAADLARRIGVSVDPDDLRCEIVSRETFPERVDAGGHWGTIHGWVGHVIVEVNAPMRWLFEVGSRIGIGGRVSIGFGRIAVSEEKA